jgi:hypothetical protein
MICSEADELIAIRVSARGDTLASRQSWLTWHQRRCSEVCTELKQAKASMTVNRTYFEADGVCNGSKRLDCLGIHT